VASQRTRARSPPVWRHALKAPEREVPGKQREVDAGGRCRQQVLALARPRGVLVRLPQLRGRDERRAGGAVRAVARDQQLDGQLVPGDVQPPPAAAGRACLLLQCGGCVCVCVRVGV
jgi:hypothetical protein